MLSAKILTDIHRAMCAVRNNTCPLGGVQVICGGDFMQLPPVPCARYGDNGEFAFASSVRPLPDDVAPVHDRRASGDIQHAPTTPTIQFSLLLCDENINEVTDIDNQWINRVEHQDTNAINPTGNGIEVLIKRRASHIRLAIRTL